MDVATGNDNGRGVSCIFMCWGGAGGGANAMERDEKPPRDKKYYTCVDNSPLCIRSMGWRCIADAARFDEFSPLDIASEGFLITGMELSMPSVIIYLSFIMLLVEKGRLCAVK
jgi:hypothetical protein